MTLEDVWAELGVDGPADRDTVRRAYARRLKVTQPEVDPNGFQRLRLAYEAALDQIESRRQEPPASADAPTAVAPGCPEADIDGSEAGDQIATDFPATNDPVAMHWDQLNNLLRKVDEGGNSDEVLNKLQAILRSPVMDNLSIYQQTNLGLTRAIASLLPKSDALVEPFLTHFGWLEDRAGYDTPPDVLYLQAHNLELGQRSDFRASHPAAYRLLTSPPSARPKKPTPKQAAAVRLLLQIARKDATWALEEFHPDSVKWWERRARRPRLPNLRPWQSMVLALGVLYSLIIVISSFLPGPPAELANHPMETSRERIASYADSRPNDPGAWAELCAATARSFWRDQSLADCDHAVSLQPESTRTLLDRAFLNLKVGRPIVTIADATNVLSREPKSAGALFARSLARAVKEELEAGRKDWCEALAISPNIRWDTEHAYNFKVAGAYASCDD